MLNTSLIDAPARNPGKEPANDPALAPTMVHKPDSKAIPRELLEMAGRYECLWRREESPVLKQFLRSNGTFNAAQLLAVLTVDQRHRWQEGDCIKAESYLADFPQLHTGPYAFDLIVSEFNLSRSMGGYPSVEDFQKRFPRYSTALQNHPELASKMNDRNGLSLTQKVNGPRPITNSAKRSERNAFPVVEGYEILEELGRGGMGVVYKAWHYNLKREVALKMILAGQHAGAEEVYRLRTEATAVARLQHPSIIQIYDIGESDGLPFYSMEYVDGGTLADQTDGAPLNPNQAAKIVNALAQAVHHAHQHGIIHRDLKPANVLLADCEEADLDKRDLKITDFGIAKIMENDQTCTGSILGTPNYMAPEQATDSHRVGTATDIYSLGAILYELLTGRPPFSAVTPTDTLILVCNDEPVAPRKLQRNIPADLETICLKCLQKSPDKRYGSANDLADDLERFLGDKPIAARPITQWERLVKWAKRRPAIAALSSALVLGGLVSFVVMAFLWQFAENKASMAYQAQKDEAKARAIAEIAQKQEMEAKKSALKAHSETAKAKQQVEQYLAQTTMDLGIAISEKGNLRSGLLFLDQSLGRLSSSQLFANVNSDLKRILRTNLAAWHHNLFVARAGLSHGDWVNDVAVSPDSRVAFTCSKDCTARLWSAQTGKPLGDYLKHDHPVWSIDCSADGRWFATASGPQKIIPGEPSTGSIRIWRMTAGSPPMQEVRFDLGAPALNVSFSKDGKRLLSTCADGLVRVWQLAEDGGKAQWKKLGRPLPHFLGVTAAEFSPDGKTILTGSNDGGARLWNPETGGLLGLPLAHNQVVSSVAFSPSGRFFATGTSVLTGDGEDVHFAEGCARIWEAQTGRPVTDRLRHQGPVKVVRFSPDGRLLAAGGIAWSQKDRELLGEVRLYQVADDDLGIPPGEMLHAPWEHPKPVWDLAFNPNGRLILTGCEDSDSRLFHVATGAQIGQPINHEGTVSNVTFTPDGRLAVTSSRGRLASTFGRIASAPPGQVDSRFIRFPGNCRAMAVRPVGNVLLVACEKDRMFACASDKEKSWSVRSSGLPNDVLDLVCSHDGKSLAILKKSGNVFLWDMPAKKKISGPLKHANRVKHMLWTKDNNYLIIRTAKDKLNGEILVWSKNGKLLRRLDTNRVGHKIHDAQLSPNKNCARLVVASANFLAVMDWNFVTDHVQQLWEEKGDNGRPTLSPDGKLVLLVGPGASSTMVKAGTGKSHGPSFILQPNPSTTCFGCGGRYLAVGDRDGKVRLWDVATCKPIGGMLHHPGSRILSLNFHPSGKHLYVLTSRNELLTWDIPQELPGTIDQIQTWAELRTSGRLHEQNVVHDLDQSERDDCLKRCLSLGELQLPPIRLIRPRPVEPQLKNRRRHLSSL